MECGWVLARPLSSGPVKELTMFPETGASVGVSVCWIGAGLETEPVASCPSGEILSEARPTMGHPSCGLTGLDPAG